MNAIKPYTKLLFIIGLILILLLPQTSILNLIGERARWHGQAMNNIGKSWPGEQIISGPLLSIPYSIDSHSDSNNNQPGRYGQLLLMPNKLVIDAQLDSSQRYRGIHQVNVYQTQATISGQFSFEQLKKLSAQHPKKQIVLGQAKLHFAVSDQRGINNQPVIQWGAEKANFLPASHLQEKQQGMHSLIPMTAFANGDTDALKPVDFSFTLNLKGMQSVRFAQLAREVDIRLASNWQHPGFIGNYLPQHREISAKGFNADWQSSAFSNGAEQLLKSCADDKCSALDSNAVGVTLVQPVNVYSLSERSVKYALLFIVLTFTALLLFELLKRLRIHPVQYLLIGLALTVFYLLLISMSEHIRFGMAYIVATLASSGLLTLYFSAILRDRKAGALLGTSLLALYGILYVILQAEDHALLMGSLLLFAILALLMLSTRHLDWYSLLESHLPKVGTDSTAAKETA